MGHNFRTIVFCPRCFIDVEEDVGYLEWKHWKYCSYCGDELVNVHIEYRPEELKEYLDKGMDKGFLEMKLRMYKLTNDSKWLELLPGMYKAGKTIFERLEEIGKNENDK